MPAWRDFRSLAGTLISSAFLGLESSPETGVIIRNNLSSVS